MCPFCSDASLDSEDSLESEGYVCDLNENIIGRKHIVIIKFKLISDLFWKKNKGLITYIKK